MITEPLFYFLAVPAVLIAGISKGGLGGGLGIMSVPLMALVIGPIQAAAIMLPILCLMDLHALWMFSGSWDRRNMRVLVPGAIAGVMIGWATFRYLDADAIQILIGAIALAFVAYRFVPGNPTREPSGRRFWVSGTVWGSLAGFTSTVAHAGGPPANIHLLPQRLDKTIFVGTMAVLFTVVNYVKLVPYWFLDQLAIGNMITALVLMPLAPIGMVMGYRLHTMIPQKTFYTVCYALLVIVGLRLVYDGVTGIIG